MQESGVSEQLALCNNIYLPNPEVQGGVFTLVPKEQIDVFRN